MKNKKTKIVIISVIALILVTIGITYAYWLVTKTQTKENVISSACLDITLSDETSAISLLTAEPLSDEDGMELVPYEFIVTNNCNTSVDYQVALETFDTAETMQASSIKVMIDDEIPTILSTKNTTNTTIKDATYAYVLKTGTLSGAKTAGANESHTLRIWIDADAPVEEMEKLFESQISITIGQGIENPVICRAVTEETRLQDQHYAFSYIDENYNTVLATELSYIGNIPEGNYEPGDEYLCEVKPGTKYRFYVLSTNNAAGEIITESSIDKEVSTVNLIMDQNITSDGTPATSENPGTVQWISESDYLAAGGTACTPASSSYTECATQEKGPITAMNYLRNAVLTWINIPNVILPENGLEIKSVATMGDQTTINNKISYGTEVYNFDYTTRARMITVEEAFAAGCMLEYNATTGEKYFFNTCPMWLSNNMQFRDVDRTGSTKINGIRGYWTLNGNGNPTDGDKQVAYEIYDHINMNSTYIYRTNYNGVRPVITLNISDLDI